MNDIINFEIDRKTAIFTVISFLGIASLLFFSIANFLLYSKLVGVIDFSFSVLFSLNYLFFVKKRDIDLSSNIFVFLAFILLILLFVTGGFYKNGIFWIYTFPLISFYLLNTYRAFVLNIAFILGLLLSLGINYVFFSQIPYSLYTVIEAIFSYTVVFLVSFHFSKTTEELINKIKDRLIYDPLTGLFNRNFVFPYMEKFLEKFKRNTEYKFCVAYVDLDNFKKVNDTKGHLEGDRVLKEVADIFQKNIRKYDVIARIGGDEFLIVFDSCEEDVIKERLEKIKKEVENKFREYGISISYGIVTIPKDGCTNPDDILSKADSRMYEQKNEKLRKKLIATLN